MIGVTVLHFLWIDICVTFVLSFVTGYPEFGFHLNRTGRPMVYSCSWPVYQIYSGISVSI
jgi:alpha-N-acetylgalactosaminidase